MRDTYYKMCLLLRSALVMNNLDHFQSVASLTRSLFELWLELKILAKDQTGEDVRKYNEFPEIERYRAAEQLVNANPQVLKADTSAQRAFLADLKRKQRQRVDAAVGTNAAGNRARYPEHWTWKSVRARAGSLGQEAMYVEVYPLLSWYVHAGATGTAGMSKGDLESMVGFCEL